MVIRAPVLEMKNICKEYFGNPVLKSVNISIYPGEIHAVVGENGAGKSTLMNILFGMPIIHSTGGYQGEVLLDGSPIKITSPYQAMKAGIGMVHQEFMLLPLFTITENIKLNREQTKPNPLSKLSEQLGTLDIPKMAADSRKALGQAGLTIDEFMPVAGLPVGHMQFIEIAREIDKTDSKVLVFDEPTAVLTETDAETLMSTMRSLSERGIAILFISHRLDEVVKAAHRVTVLRDGEQVATMKQAEVTVPKLAELMVGRQIKRLAQTANINSAETMLGIRSLKTMMPGEEIFDFTIDIKRGEILGIGGLAGHGKLGVANGIMGLYPAQGVVTLNGLPIPLNSPLSALKNGLAFVSEDRRGVGLLLDESIENNIAMTAMLSKGNFLRVLGPLTLKNHRAVRNHARKTIADLDIRCTGPDQVTRRLSGGNQQKVCIARAISLEPKMLFVSEPTRGIDIGAKEIVLELLIRLNRELGMTIVMTSSELAELRSLCHRIAIVYKGTLEGILPPDAPDVEFGLMMAGETHRKEGCP